jgi:hypothetical protein
MSFLPKQSSRVSARLVMNVQIFDMWGHNAALKKN